MPKVALAVPRVTAIPATNLATVTGMARQAAAAGANLVLFPEAVLTGLVNNDDPEHDLPLGQPIPGPATRHLAEVAQAHEKWIGLGLLEVDGDKLYDSAILLSPVPQEAGDHLALHYRRIHPGWHDPQANPAVYRHGEDLSLAVTPLGRTALLICGDLFDDELVARVRALHADWLLFPFARCFTGGGVAQERWEREEMPSYAERVKAVGIPALMVNYLADDSLVDDYAFGGAFIVSAQGEVLLQHPLGRAGLLITEV